MANENQLSDADEERVAGARCVSNRAIRAVVFLEDEQPFTH